MRDRSCVWPSMYTTTTLRNLIAMSHDKPRNDSRLVARLIGPLGREVSCETCFEQLDRYVELKLSGVDADAAIPGMQAHFQGCPACADDRDSLVALLALGPGSNYRSESP